MEKYQSIARILLWVYAVSGGVVAVLAILFATAGTLFSDNPNVSYFSFITPIIACIVSIAVLVVISYLCYKHQVYIWSMIAGFPIIAAIIYGVYYFMTTPYK